MPFILKENFRKVLIRRGIHQKRPMNLMCSSMLSAAVSSFSPTIEEERMPERLQANETVLSQDSGATEEDMNSRP